GSAVHCEDGRIQVLEVVAACAVGIDATDVERITRSKHRGGERRTQLSGPTPLVAGVTGGFVRERVVTGMVVVGRDRPLGQAQSLLDTKHCDEVGSHKTALRGYAVGGGAEAGTNHGRERISSRHTREARVEKTAIVVGIRVLRRQRERRAIAELPSIAQLVDAGNVAAAANQTVEVVRGIVGPGQAELRDRLTHREPGELDEGVVDAQRTTGDLVVPEYRSGAGDTQRTRRPVEYGLEEGTQHAILGRGPRIDGEVFAGASGEVVAVTVKCACQTIVRANENGVRGEGGFRAQVTSQLNASVGARYVEESGTIQGADPHVL